MKSLAAVFPIGDSMALIVDDRHDAWVGGAPLVRIKPCLSCALPLLTTSTPCSIGTPVVIPLLTSPCSSRTADVFFEGASDVQTQGPLLPPHMMKRPRAVPPTAASSTPSTSTSSPLQPPVTSTTPSPPPAPPVPPPPPTATPTSNELTAPPHPTPDSTAPPSSIPQPDVPAEPAPSLPPASHPPIDAHHAPVSPASTPASAELELEGDHAPKRARSEQAVVADAAEEDPFLKLGGFLGPMPHFTRLATPKVAPSGSAASPSASPASAQGEGDANASAAALAAAASSVAALDALANYRRFPSLRATAEVGTESPRHGAADVFGEEDTGLEDVWGVLQRIHKVRVKRTILRLLTPWKPWCRISTSTTIRHTPKKMHLMALRRSEASLLHQSRQLLFR